MEKPTNNQNIVQNQKDKSTAQSTINQITKKSLDTRYIKRRILIYMALKNLTYKKLRTILTVAGVVIGIGSIVFLLSLGLGLQLLVTKQVIGAESIKTIDVTAPKSNIIILNNNKIEEISKIEGIEKTAKTYTFASKFAYKGAATDSVLYGLTPEYMELSSLKPVAAKSLEIKDTGDVIVNTTLLKSAGLPQDDKAIGEHVKITTPIAANLMSSGNKKIMEQEFTIIGIVDSGKGAEAFISNKVFDNLGVKQYSQLKILAKNKEAVGEIRKKINNMGLTTQSPIDTLDQINQIFRFFNFILVGFGGIGMLIAVLGMFNTLTISLLERTKEIGLLVSIGARSRDVRRLFIFEALILSLLGGVIGVIGAFALGKLIDFILMRIALSRGITDTFSIFSLPTLIIVYTLMFIVMVGLIVVYIPARRASRISPIDALRHE